MRYLSNFINNIKRIFNNIKYILCCDFHKLFNHINNKADKSNLLKYDIEDLKNDIVTLNKRIDFIHSKLEKYQVKDIDMMKIYIDDNEELLKKHNKRLDKIERYLQDNFVDKHILLSEINLFYKKINRRLDEIEFN
tara:strand:+ start:35 stop:442 length:408 start_codon:yes stop_codon:yes gene_type:complete